MNDIDSIDLKVRIDQLKNKITELGDHLEVNRKKERIKEISQKMSSNSFWQDQMKANQITKEFKDLQNMIEEYQKITERAEELDILYELNCQENNSEVWQEIVVKIGEIEEEVEKQKRELLFAGEYDKNNAIVSIHPGAGGTESQDWAEMLLRMYLRWAERNSFKTEIVDLLPAEEAGIKSVTFTVKGKNAFGLLKSEKGIHRLVRISPFDANKRRHTSFASVDVIPEIEDDIKIDIAESDLRIDTYRSTGAGGQYVNTTDSAVRITHLPTNIVVQCQNERSQYSNRLTAMKILKARLFEYYQKKQEEDLERLSGEKKDIAWGNQIRSYVFQPYQMVKDHRTKVESSNVTAIMDGGIDIFIDAYLSYYQKYNRSNSPHSREREE
ncbi:MAG: peptide chain release factor 2 [Atribacterota bacterium]|nr:peptide chain release factor 2 [Atribacterota bacterium]MDD5497567.1 peptide chain release factor 2 [Atribacterota bacterium]